MGYAGDLVHVQADMEARRRLNFEPLVLGDAHLCWLFL